MEIKIKDLQREDQSLEREGIEEDQVPEKIEEGDPGLEIGIEEDPDLEVLIEIEGVTTEVVGEETGTDITTEEEEERRQPVIMKNKFRKPEKWVSKFPST